MLMICAEEAAGMAIAASADKIQITRRKRRMNVPLKRRDFPAARYNHDRMMRHCGANSNKFRRRTSSLAGNSTHVVAPATATPKGDTGALDGGFDRTLSASLIGRLGSSAFRLSTTTVSMSLAGSCFSSESAPRPLYGVFFVKELARAAKLSFVGFLVRSQSPFLRPDLRIADVDARKICTRLAVTPTLRHASPLPGHTMTASSTTAR